MYEIYLYPRSRSYNIRRTSDLYTVGYHSTLQKCLKEEFTPCKARTREEFESEYGCKYLFTVPSLEALEQDYPELFI